MTSPKPGVSANSTTVAGQSSAFSPSVGPLWPSQPDGSDASPTLSEAIGRAVDAAESGTPDDVKRSLYQLRVEMGAAAHGPVRTPPVIDPLGVLFGGIRSTVAARLFSKCVVDDRDCWIFTGASRGVGYGAVKIGHKAYDTHRIAYELVNGPIPPRMLVMHSCDVRRCCNPAHLSLGTHKDNHDDMAGKGRRARLDHSQIRAGVEHNAAA